MSHFGVVIPTHQGSRLLVRSMTSLARQRFTGKLAVVVAVNDSRADSFAQAQRLAPMLTATGAACTVIRTPPGRGAAFDAADRHLPPAPRLYLDQDATLSPRAIADLAEALAPGTGVHFAVPVLRLAPPQSLVSRAYYRVWRELPYVRRSPVTFGAYAVSEQGRRRWGEFPRLHSDDKWVRWHFAPHERRIVESASYEVVVPDGLAALVRARCRYHRGNRELVTAAKLPPHPDDFARYHGALRSLVTTPARWPAAAVFLAVHGMVALLHGRPGMR
ncbi:glycosyltransferase [Micromonospora sonneratiae]|uniref:Glycosyltransferase family 2 protein n=1 Tax=Micromonospora sonneratiae TaxID=1184706 RepID=A0ABW3YQ13_9ACTN